MWACVSAVVVGAVLCAHHVGTTAAALHPHPQPTTLHTQADTARAMVAVWGVGCVVGG